MKPIPAAVFVAVAHLLAAGSAEAATWTVDTTNSKLGFVASMNGQSFNGSFQTWTAKIDFDPANIAAAKATVTIDMASASTNEPTRDAALPLPDWFDVASYPTATFESTTFRAKGGEAYEADGTLTIRGISKPITLPFTLNIVDDDADMNAKVTILRTDFGVGQGQFAGDQPVAAQVDVIVHLVARSAH